MKVYIPTPITSAEQAESLPVGTVAQHDEQGYARHIAVRIFRDDGDPRAWRSHRGHALRTHARMVGWTALVPIEAKEELAHMDPWEGIYDPTTREEAEKLGPLPAQPLHTRLVTPWTPTEEA